eukprot:UN02127
MAFVPQLITKFGSSADDLIKRKLEGEEKHTLIINSQAGNFKPTFTVNTVKGSTGSLQGKLALKYEDKAWGDSTMECHTAGQGKIAYDVRLTKVAPNTTITTRIESDTKLSTVAASSAVQYRQESLAASVEYKQVKNSLFTGLVWGYEGFSAGAQITTNITSLANQKPLTEAITVDAGLQYEDRNLTTTFMVDNTNNLSLSAFHNVNSQTQIAGKIVAGSDAKKMGNSGVIAAQYKLSPNTILKGKLHFIHTVNDQKMNIYNYAVAGHVEHKIASPDLTVGVTSYIDSTKQVPAFSINASFNAK